MCLVDSRLTNCRSDSNCLDHTGPSPSYSNSPTPTSARNLSPLDRQSTPDQIAEEISSGLVSLSLSSEEPLTSRTICGSQWIYHSLSAGATQPTEPFAVANGS